MNKEVEQLKTKSNEEICALITRLNSQLLESRFKMAAGEIEKTHLLRQIRTTIAQCMYILNTRGYTVSVGSHGIYLIERKDNKINDVTEKVSKLINDMVSSDKTSKKPSNEKEKSAPAKGTLKEATKKEEKTEATPEVKESK